jgi:hypothetical protein
MGVKYLLHKTFQKPGSHLRPHLDVWLVAPQALRPSDSIEHWSRKIPFDLLGRYLQPARKHWY